MSVRARWQPQTEPRTDIEPTDRMLCGRSDSFATRELGFTLEEVRSLLGLWQDESRASHEVAELAQRRMEDIDS